MSLVTGEALGKYYGAQDVFWDISLRIEDGDKIALTGPNGVGKSTLLRIISELEEPSAGQVHRKRGLRIGFLAQETEPVGQGTLWEEMERAFVHLERLEKELRRLERRMATERAPLRRYSALLEQFERKGGYTYEARIRQVLAGLGFAEGDFHRPLNEFSGGEGTRTRLAHLLLESPDLLLLDEPTNHLDLRAIEWLENWLASWPGSLVVVAHDRYFLDKVVDRVWDLSFGKLEVYPGNYSTYVRLKQERTERRRREFEAQEAFVTRTEEFIRRYRAGQRSKEARGREKRLARLERLARPRQHRSIHLSIQPATRSGEMVLASQDLVVGRPARTLFACPDLYLGRGECAALVGPNGSGKTTLILTMLGEVEPVSGHVWLGHNVKVGYLPQRQEDLAPERTVLEEILSVKELPQERARTFLGRFLFSGDDVFKPIADLSGGERSRVALAQLTLQGANFLVLDEPTNHLDIGSREILADVLGRFQGAILFVSHDRSLVDQLATQVWVIEGPELVVHQGNYTDYLTRGQMQHDREEVAPTAPSDSRRHVRAGGQREAQQRLRRAAALEQEIAELEARLGELEGGLSLASRARRVEELHRLGREYTAAQGRLQELIEEWAQVSS